MITNANKISVTYDNKPSYNITFHNSFEDVMTELEPLSLANRKVCIVSDTNVAPFYATQLQSQIKSSVSKVVVFAFEAGEENKNLATVQSLYEFLIKHTFDRNDILIALGGGVVGDLTGFAAATYLRGIRFIQVPTSLLAMVDSSVGGKTGVDFMAYKNMVGAFHMPKCVYMNLTCLTTLTSKVYLSGMGEVIKHGLIKDKEFYQWLRDHVSDVQEKNLAALAYMVNKNCEIKRNVVEQDPLEQGERALLNFGHTIGHAVEKLMNFTLLHGECVAIGMVAAAYLSKMRGTLTEEEFENIISTFIAYSLPICVESLNVEEVLFVALSDKKMDAGNIKFILLESIGTAYIETTLTKDEMAEAIRYIIKTPAKALEDAQ